MWGKRKRLIVLAFYIVKREKVFRKSVGQWADWCLRVLLFSLPAVFPLSLFLSSLAVFSRPHWLKTPSTGNLIRHTGVYGYKIRWGRADGQKITDGRPHPNPPPHGILFLDLMVRRKFSCSKLTHWKNTVRAKFASQRTLEAIILLNHYIMLNTLSGHNSKL